MSFWGCKVSQGKESAYVPSAEEDLLLHVSQACLDPGAKKGSKAILMVKSHDDGPYAVCSLREGGTESVSLDLMLEDYSEFSVVGNASVHLTGYQMPQDDDGGDMYDEDDEFGEDGALLGYDAEGLPIYMDDDDDEDDEDIDLDDDESDEDDEDDEPGIGQKNVIIEDVTGDLEEDDSEEEESDDEEEQRAAAAAAAAAAKEAEEKKQKRKAAEQKEKEQKKAKSEDLSGNKVKVKKFPNGFEIHDIHQGKASGKLVKAGKRVSVRYSGRLTNGKIFDQTKGNKTFQFRFGVGEVIKGWDRGMEGMRVGDKRKLVVPPLMGYGASKVGPIPANSTLIFEIELVDVKN
jgi:FK506-binding nuclear protein